MPRQFTSAVAFTSLFALPALADDVFSDDVIIQSRLCVGSSTCVDGEAFGDSSIKIKAFEPKIEFFDRSTGSPTTWAVAVDDQSSGIMNSFTLHDTTADTYPFLVQNAAPTNTLFVSSNGNVGIGTSLPLSSLHLTTSGGPAVVLEQTGGTPQTFALAGNEGGFRVIDITGEAIPFTLEPGAPEGAVYVQSDGAVGFGTQTPNGGLELSTDAAFNFFRITATGAAVNDSVDITFTQGPLGTGQLRYNIVDGDNQEMSLDADGNLVIDGTLTTSGPTCAGGCDRVFDAGYDLPSIQEHQAAMWAAGHLPAVGPTLAHQPVNLSETLGQLLNELEHAHIYIGQLHKENRAMADQIAELSARLDAVETK